MAHSGQNNSNRHKSIIRCVRDLDNAKAELQRLSNRTNSVAQKEAIHTVDCILEEIRTNGDNALIQFTEKFDGFKPDPLKVPQKVLANAWETIPSALKNALEVANDRIKAFHQLQLPKDLLVEGKYGEKLGRRWRAVKKAGIYIPGGRASYPSTVLMNAIPAQVAGVEEITMVTPANSNGEINPVVLAAAYLTGIKNVIRIGGAQAIAALAYGTETINKVDVITGPGNLYVTLAKKAVYGQVGIDSLAGPSEVLIIADETAKSEQIAADLLAQSEHDPLAASLLLTTDNKLAEELPSEIEKQLKNHPREDICRASLHDWGLIVICNDMQTCISLSDEFAPEHLELLVKNPNSLLEKINNVGAIFIGEWSPEATGDYLAGPNHTLPTSGSARYSGALSVETFMKNTSLIEFTESALRNTSDAIRELAKSEGLHSHSESVRIRTTK